MRHRRALALLFLALTLIWSVSGCTSASPKPATRTARVKLYYGSAGNERLLYETRIIHYSSPRDKYAQTLTALFSGPSDPKLVANISPHTRILHIDQQGNDLVVDLNKNFGSFAGSSAELVAIGSLVNTLVQFPEIERVKIKVEGRELIGPTGLPRGFMAEFQNNFEPTLETRNIVLYFADQNATYVRPERRQIRVKPGISESDFITAVLLELIAGPRSGTLYRTIPQETNVRSVAREGKTIHVDFSPEIETKHWGGAAGETMTLYSLVATLTELPDVDKVRLTVEGKPLTIEHMVLDQPMGRSPDMIQP